MLQPCLHTLSHTSCTNLVLILYYKKVPVAEFMISEAKSSSMFLSHQHLIADGVTAAGIYVRQ